MAFTTLGQQSSNFISQKKRRDNSFKVFVILLIIMLVIVVGVLLFDKFKKGPSNKSLDLGNESETKVNALTEEKRNLAENILEDFSKIYELPVEEEPTIIAITDVEKLKAKDPTFYENAKNGDKMIVLFTKKIAIIFRQEDLKIINVAPVTVDN